MSRLAFVETAGLKLIRVGYGHPDSVRLIEEVQAEYVIRYGGRDETPIDPSEFESPDGTFLVGYVGDEPAATGGWRRRTDLEIFGDLATAEIKRMYVSAPFRRAGHARAMLAELERTAADAGIEALILETGLRQPEAIAFYASAGYGQIPGFGHYRDSPSQRCFGKRL